MFLLLGAVIVVPVFSGIASAHHSNIAATVVCDGTVSWTATSWSTGSEGTNTDIRVTKTVAGVTTEVGKGAFNSGNGYKFSGTFTWPKDATSIVVTSTPNAAWGNGVVSTTGSSVTVSKPTGCLGTPSVTNVVSCTTTSPGHGDGTVVLSLKNNGGPFAATINFIVYNPDQTTSPTTYPVAVGATQLVTFNGLADGNHTVKIMAGSTDLSQTFSVACDAPIPAVTLTQTCANGDGQVVATLTNTGGKPVVFDVTDPKTGTVEHVTVNADSSTTRTFSGLADGNYTLVVMVGTTNLSKSFTIDCKHPLPRVSSSVVCDSTHDGSVTITLANDGTEAMVFHVTNPFTNAVEDVTVAAGGSTTRTFAGFSDGTHTVAITAAGFTGLSQTFKVACDIAPSYSFTQSCVEGDGSVAVTMTNNGDDVNALFVLAGTSYTLVPGETKVVNLSGLTDGSHLIPLTVNGVDKSFTITVDCDRPGEPAVEVAQSCANDDGVVVVTLKNLGGQLPLTFTVEGTDYVVPAGSSVPVTLSGLVDGTHTIAIHHGDLDLSQTVTVACDQPPTVSFTESCVEGANGHADGQVLVTLNNNGDDVAVTFTVNDTVYVVAPNASQVVTISGLSDGVHHIAVLAGAVDLSFDVTVACDHPGQGSVTSAVACANADGVVTVSLVATGGELPVTFTVMGVQYILQPDTTQNVVLSGLADGTQHISVFVGDTDLSFNISMVCDVQASPPAPAPVPDTAADTLVVLPATGPANVTPLLVIAFGSVLLGGALLVFKRRLGVR